MLALGVLRELQRIREGFSAPNPGLCCLCLLERTKQSAICVFRFSLLRLQRKKKVRCLGSLVHAHTLARSHTDMIERDMMSG